jgi:UDP-glucose 4-epimerase
VPVREHDRPDASGISTAKAVRMLGWRPQRSWRDYLDDAGRLRPEVRERLERGDTGVHRGRAAGTPG